MPLLSEGIWILPQLRRPRGYEELVNSIMWADPTARVLVVFDDDDEDLLEAQALTPSHWTSIIMSPGATTVQKINAGCRFYPDERFYGLLANDIEIKTDHALTLLAEHCPEFGLSYPEDSIQGAGLATHPCVSGRLVRALGWWAYPKACHTGIDVYLTNVAYDAGGCHFLPQVSFYHKHHTHQRSLYDEVYEKADMWKTADLAADKIWRETDQVAANERVRAAQCQV